MQSSFSQEKQAIRSQMLKKRRQLLEEQSQNASEQVAQILLNVSIFKSSQRIACYYAYRKEVNTLKIIKSIFSQKKECYLPVIKGDPIQEMFFIACHSLEELVPNRFGILEPLFQSEKGMNPPELDLVIVPLVAFDRRGYRLGMGGGCYDRTFAFLNQLHPSSKKPFLCGLAYSFQEVPSIPINDWDIRLDAVVTDQEFIRF